MSIKWAFTVIISSSGIFKTVAGGIDAAFNTSVVGDYYYKGAYELKDAEYRTYVSIIQQV